MGNDCATVRLYSPLIATSPGRHTAVELALLNSLLPIMLDGFPTIE